MEELLLRIEQEDGLGKLENYSTDNVTQALARFTEALRNVLLLFEQETKDGEEDTFSVNAKWLLDLCKGVPSELGPSRLARAIWDASRLVDENQQQEALFAALGASDEAMDILFQIAPNLARIRQNISLLDLGEDEGSSQGHAATIIDPEEEYRQKLRQEAFNAAQVAAIAKAEADAVISPSLSGTTHTIARSSDKKAQKAADKAAKLASQALQRARKAGAIIDEAELLAVNSASFGSGGLMNRSTDELLALQQSLLPEGSRVYYNEEGLPIGTERDYNEEIGYERVVIPPPRLDPSKLHPRLTISDILDPQSARAFAGTTSLNPMQSTVFDTAFNRRENMLICAPTGAGKL
jgi:hypothetical protein